MCLYVGTSVCVQKKQGLLSHAWPNHGLGRIMLMGTLVSLQEHNADSQFEFGRVGASLGRAQMEGHMLFVCENAHLFAERLHNTGMSAQQSQLGL